MALAVELPQRSSSRRQSPGGSLVSRAGRAAGLDSLLCFLCPAQLPKAWSWNRGALSPVPLLQPLTSSCSVHLKAAGRLLLQLLQVREGKSFLPETKKPASQAKPNHTAPQKCTWAVRVQKCHQKTQLPPLPQPCTHPVLSLKDTATVFGHKTEDHGIDYHHKSAQDGGLSKTHWQRDECCDLVEFLQ